MQTDYVGSQAIVSLIEQTNLCKFVISRIGNSTKNNIPVFEFIEKGSCDKCISAFVKWSQIADNNLPYEMKLFNTIEDSEMNGEELRNKKQGKVLVFTFCLNKEQNFSPQHQGNQNIDVNMAIENALMKYQAKANENALLDKLNAMELKLNQLEEEDDDDDESELSGLQNPNMLNLLGLLSKALGGNNNKSSAVINGLNDVKIANINKAVKILAKYDDEIDTDLLKLSSLAESNPDTFNMLLKTLRSM
jgi:hypothetical protein